MSKIAEGARDNATKLLELAKKNFRPLTKAEEKLFRAVLKGEPADCSDKLEKNNDPNGAKQWDKKTRVIRADCVAWLCTEPQVSAMVTHKGIFVKGARIDGELDLAYSKISFPLHFEKSAFPKVINLRYAEIRGLFLIGTHTGQIYGDGLKVEGYVFLREGFKAEGEVRLLGATIGGNLECDGGQFINPKSYALNAAGLNVEGYVFLREGFKAEGEVNLLGATIGGNLECDGGQFINSTGYALNADGVKVEGNVFLHNGFKAEGQVRLPRAAIGIDFSCIGGEFIDKGAKALIAAGLNVEGYVFLREGFKAEGEVNLLGATVGGNLECDGGHFINTAGYALNAEGVNVEDNVFLRGGFKTEGEVNLRGAKIGGDLVCEKGKFINPKSYALNAAGLNVEGYFFLREGFEAEGEVNLLGATIGANLECDGGQFINSDGYALNAAGLNVEGYVFLRGGFKAEGEVNLVGAAIGGNLECDGGQFINSDGYALNADGMNVEDNVFLRKDFKAQGIVDLIGATISGALDCAKGEFINPRGYALVADNLNIKGSAYLRSGFQAEGAVSLVGTTISGYFVWMDVNSPEKMTLDLRSVRIGTLWDDANSWPDPSKLFLHGLVYNEIYDRAPRDAKSRIDWLRRQPGFRPQPYEQLAAVLRKGGRDGAAKKILIAKNKDRAQLAKTWSEKCWYRAFGRMIGYGYRPLNALWGVLLFVALGWILFGIGYRARLVTPQSESAYVEKNVIRVDGGAKARELSNVYPSFNFVVYSIDTFVPLIDLHQAKYWLPNANRGPELLNIKAGGLLRFYLWIHIVMGWVLTTLLVVGLTGLVRT